MDVVVSKAMLGLREGVDTCFGVIVDFRLLAWNAGTGPSLDVLRDAVPDELLLQEGHHRAGRRMNEAMDEVEDGSMELERNPWARMVSADVAEESGATVVEGNVLPLKSCEGGSAGGRLKILLL